MLLCHSNNSLPYLLKHYPSERILQPSHPLQTRLLLHPPEAREILHAASSGISANDPRTLYIQLNPLHPPSRPEHLPRPLHDGCGVTASDDQKREA